MRAFSFFFLLCVFCLSFCAFFFWVCLFFGALLCARGASFPAMEALDVGDAVTVVEPVSVDGRTSVAELMVISSDGGEAAPSSAAAVGPPRASKIAGRKSGGGGGGSGGAGSGGTGGRARGWYVFTPGTCCVCNSARVTPTNAIIYCSACDACYHQACYGKGRKSALRYAVPPGFWRCGEGPSCRALPKATAAAWSARLIQLAADEHELAARCGITWCASGA